MDSTSIIAPAFTENLKGYSTPGPLRASTLHHAKGLYGRCIQSAWGGLYIEDVTKQRAKALLLELERQGLNVTRNRTRALIGALFNYASDVLDLPGIVNPVKGRSFKGPKENPRPCRAAGLITPSAPTAEQALAAERAALLARVPGSWGLVGRPDEPSCQRAFRLNVLRRGEEDVVALTDGDYESAMRVVTALDGVINLRALPPAEKVGEPSELHPEADRLTWHYSDGRSAAYVRCGG